MDKKFNGNTFIVSLSVYEGIHILTNTHIYTHINMLYMNIQSILSIIIFSHDTIVSIYIIKIKFIFYSFILVKCKTL